MRPIDGKAKSVRQLLQGVKYSIDYYQREYRWEAKQVRELIDDLSDMFLEEYETGISRSSVADFPHYFLGSIIISQRGGKSFIVDGQQRLTSLTLLLIVLRNLQLDREDAVQIDDLIFSERYGTRRSISRLKSASRAWMHCSTAGHSIRLPRVNRCAISMRDTRTWKLTFLRNSTKTLSHISSIG